MGTSRNEGFPSIVGRRRNNDNSNSWSNPSLLQNHQTTPKGEQSRVSIIIITFDSLLIAGAIGSGIVYKIGGLGEIMKSFKGMADKFTKDDD
jgi:hypothetical protein